MTRLAEWRLRFGPSLWRHRAAIAASLALSLVSVAATVLAPWPLKYIIDSVLAGLPLPAWTGLSVSDSNQMHQVLFFSGLGVLIAVVGAVSGAVSKKIDARVRERMTLELRDALLAHIQTLPLTDRANDRTGELALRIVDDVAQAVRLLTKTAPLAMRYALTTVALLGIMIWLDTVLGLLGVALVGLLAALARYFARPLGEATRDKRQREGAVAALAQEILRGLPAVQALGVEKEVRDEFAGTNRNSLGAGVRETEVAVSMEQAMQIANGVAFALITAWGAAMVLDGQLTIGSLTIYVAYIVQLVKPVEKINELASTIARGIARGDRVLAMLARAPAVVDCPGAMDLPAIAGRIRLDNVSYSYPASSAAEIPRRILDRANLTVEPGTLTVITGASGSGKSTLLMLLLRIIEPHRGQLFLDDMPYESIRVSSLRRGFAVMLQESHVFAGTVRQCLDPAGRRLRDTSIWQALERVSLAEFVHGLPGGLDGMLGEAAANLSGGQRARLCLARALLQEGPVLLLDEPLANVDAQSQQVIVEALRELRGRRTCIAVSHQTALNDVADRVLALDRGQLRDVTTTGRSVVDIREASKWQSLSH